MGQGKAKHHEDQTASERVSCYLQHTASVGFATRVHGGGSGKANQRKREREDEDKKTWRGGERLGMGVLREFNR